MIKWLEKNNKLSWGGTLLIALFISYMSSKVFRVASSPVISWLPIAYHFLVFASLSFFLLISSLKGKKDYSIFVVCFLILLTYGILDEFHQFFVPGRAFTIFDMFVDSLGILFSSGIYFARINLSRLK